MSWIKKIALSASENTSNELLFPKGSIQVKRMSCLWSLTTCCVFHCEGPNFICFWTFKMLDLIVHVSLKRSAPIPNRSICVRPLWQSSCHHTTFSCHKLGWSFLWQSTWNDWRRLLPRTVVAILACFFADTQAGAKSLCVASLRSELLPNQCNV